MSTRRVLIDAQRRQHGLASDPVYAAAQGIQGTIVTKKAGILTSQRARNLLFFLQALSLPELAGRPNPGGLKRWVREFLNEFSSRFDRASMRRRELVESNLAQFIIGLCTDPKMLIVAPGEEESSFSRDELSQAWPDIDTGSICAAGVSWFRDIIGALWEFQESFARRQAEGFAATSIARQVFSALDAGLRLQRIVLINGLEGIGKSEAARGWCAQHLGESRYVDLTGINNKTSFFRSIARALGLPSSESLNTAQLQTRIEAMLQRSGLMLVIDEAHYIWPQSERSEAPPEIMNWINTALCNRGVPVGLVTTPQFVASMQRVEKKTGWNSGQFMRRIKRVVQLSERPDQRDLEAVARKLVPKASESFLKMVVGFAGSQKRHHMDALADVIKESAEIARVEGREVPTFTDARAAIDGVLVPSTLAKQSIFANAKQTSRRPIRPAEKPSIDETDAPEELPATNRLASIRHESLAEV